MTETNSAGLLTEAEAGVQVPKPKIKEIYTTIAGVVFLVCYIYVMSFMQSKLPSEVELQPKRVLVEPRSSGISVHDPSIERMEISVQQMKRRARMQHHRNHRTRHRHRKT